MVSKTVGPYVVVVLLSRTIGYSFSFSKELILVVLLEVTLRISFLDPSLSLKRNKTVLYNLHFTKIKYVYDVRKLG